MGFLAISPRAAERIDRDSAELLFFQAICAGDAESAASLFEETQQFGGKSVVDAPQGRYAGKQEIARFAQKWLLDFGAEAAEVEPVTQTVGGGRSASEVIVHFRRGAERTSIPMCIVGDIRPSNRLDGVRVYFYYGWLPGFSAYRRIIFQPEHMDPAPYSLMTGSVRRYFELLHGRGDAQRRIDEIVALTLPDATFGGYRPDWVEPADSGHEAMRSHYVCICEDAPDHYRVRAEAIIDDGVQCVVEWTLVVPEAGYQVGRVAQSGVAVYERDPESGLLRSIRICDNVGKEDEIFLDELPAEIRPLVAAYREAHGVKGPVSQKQ